MELKYGKPDIERYISDESNAFKANPELVQGILYPECEEDVVLAVIEANEKQTFINVSGSGTGITGSRVPMHGGMVLSTERMLRSRQREGCKEVRKGSLAGEIRIFIDEKNGLAHVPPGISLSELASALPPGTIYPPDPTETAASLGGTVATNASGARCFHYGATRKWIEGLRAVLADGEVLGIQRGECLADSGGMLSFRSESGKRYSFAMPRYRMPGVKNAAGLFTSRGMDLIDLFIGSEGILGIFTEITVRLKRLPGEPLTDIAFFGSHSDAMEYVSAVRRIRENGILALEYFHESALEFIRDQYPDIPLGAAAAVLVEIENIDAEALPLLSELIMAHKGIADWCASSSPDRRDMKEFRHALPDSVNTYLKLHESYKLGTDFAVPVQNFPRMMDIYLSAGSAFERGYPREGAHWIMFGHIGDCHVHFNFITMGVKERSRAIELCAELAKEAVSMGGTVSAEHGVGKKTIPTKDGHAPYLELMYGDAGLSEIARIKRELDPNWVLSPGNMVPIRDSKR